jgi:hypothetical protein
MPGVGRLAFRYGPKSAFRQNAWTNLCRLDSGPISWRDETVILEIKGVLTLLPVHDMQLQTYLRMSGLPVGPLFNVHALRLKDGLRRVLG